MWNNHRRGQAARPRPESRGKAGMVFLMIEYTEGNLLEANVEALVNTVNEVGVMGKGIALQFREAFPASAREYTLAARHKDVRVGHVLVTRDDALDGPKWIIHFPVSYTHLTLPTNRE